MVGGGDGESGVRQLLEGLEGLASASASASEIEAAPPLQSRYESNSSPESRGCKQEGLAWKWSFTGKPRRFGVPFIETPVPGAFKVLLLIMIQDGI